MKDNNVELCHFHRILAADIIDIKRQIMPSGLEIGSVLEDPVY
jgi:hypothetical protein